MTKAVRIENADTNTDFKIVVQVMNIHLDAAGKPTGETSLQAEKQLNHPTAMLELYIHSGQFLIVKEAE